MQCDYSRAGNVVDLFVSKLIAQPILNFGLFLTERFALRDTNLTLGLMQELSRHRL